MTKEETLEFEWLLFFYQYADFGPADYDVRKAIKDEYVKNGGVIPLGYGDED